MRRAAVVAAQGKRSSRRSLLSCKANRYLERNSKQEINSKSSLDTIQPRLSKRAHSSGEQHSTLNKLQSPPRTCQVTKALSDSKQTPKVRQQELSRLSCTSEHTPRTQHTEELLSNSRTEKLVFQATTLSKIIPSTRKFTNSYNKTALNRLGRKNRSTQLRQLQMCHGSFKQIGNTQSWCGSKKQVL